MKALIWTDLEGVAGITSFDDQVLADSRYYEQAKELLTAEVNAAVEGLLERDIEDILVADYHGPGGICYEILHPQARLLHGRPLAPAEVLHRLYQEFDVAMIIGQHAMAGTEDGNLNHTMCSSTIDHYKLNGKFIGEIAHVGLYLGALNVPLIYLTGDEAACREAKELIPQITTAAVKTGLSRNCAISLSKEQARSKIKEAAIAAIDNHKNRPIKPLVWKGPFVLEKRFCNSETADSNCPDGYERIDPCTVQISSDNILDVLKN